MKKHYILLAVIANLHAYSQTTYNSSELIQKGIELKNEGKFVEASKNFEEVNISDPNYLIGQYELISAHLSANELEKSLKLSTQLYNDKKYEEYPDLLSLHGIVLSNNDKLQEAMEVFEVAEKKFPQSTHVLFNKAVVYQKQNKKQEALNTYKQIIEIDPTHTSALYNLGLIALEDGKIVNGSLALMTYLMVDPIGAQAKQSIWTLNKKYHQNYSNKPTLQYNENDSFKELEQLLMAQVQFHENFKLKVTIDDIAIRNMQAILDYLEKYPLKTDDFYTKQFAAPLKKIATDQQTANYLYTTTLSIGDIVEKDLNKQKKNIENYIENYLSNQILPSYYSVSKDNTTYRIFREGYEKAYAQVKPTDLNFKEGKTYAENTIGYKTAESTYKNNLLNGAKTYFIPMGNIVIIENYKDDVLNGLNKEFYQNNVLKGEYNYTNGNLSGLYKAYYPTSNLHCEGFYENNEYNQKSECFYPNGSKRLVATYLNGKFNGLYENYDEIGNLIFKTNYLNNEIDGDIKEYYFNNTIKRAGTYKNGKPVTDTYYFFDGKKAAENEYKDGKMVAQTFYRIDGTLLNKILYDNKEQKTENHDYNRSNQVYQIDYFKNGSYDKTEYKLANVKPANTGNKKQFNYNALGKLVSEGNYSKDVAIGEWSYYDAFGNLKSKNIYDNEGKITSTEGYATSGNISYKINYKDNVYYGKYEQYLNNKLVQLSYYNENGLNGPDLVYYPSGVLHYNSFYTDGLLTNNKFTYSINNNLINTEHYISNILTQTTSYLTPTPTTFNFENKTGVFETQVTPVTFQKYELKNGVKNGVTILKTKDLVLEKENFVNNNFHGKQEYFNILGNKTAEINTVNGLKHGNSKWYDEMGNLRASGDYVLNETLGTFSNYYYNQKPYSTSTYEQDIKHGPHTYFDFNGNKIAEIIFYEGTPIKYTTYNTNGNEITKDITNGTFDMVSYYKNGNKSIEINFKNYEYNGVYKIFFENGKPAIEMEFNNGNQNNKENTYYANGTLYVSKNYENNYLTKTTTYYSENGNKALDINYAFDLLHGNYIIYENNNIKTTAKFNTDQLVEI